MTESSKSRGTADSRRRTATVATRTNRARRRFVLETLESRVLLSFYTSSFNVDPVTAIGAVTITDGSGSPVITISATTDLTVFAQGGFLEHIGDGNTGSGAGQFATAFDWDSNTPGVQKLAANLNSSLTINQNGATDTLTLGTNAFPADSVLAQITQQQESGISSALTINDSTSPLAASVYTYDGFDGLYTGPLGNIVNVEAVNTLGVTILGGTANDIFNVTGTFSGSSDSVSAQQDVIEPVYVVGGPGNNTVNVGFDNTLSEIGSPVVVTDPTGTATLNILDSADTTSDFAEFDNLSGYLQASYEVTGLSDGPIAYGAGVTLLNLYGGTAGVEYDVIATQLGTQANLYNNGDDTVFVTNDGSVTDILGSVYVENELSFTNLIVDASADTTDHTATLAGGVTVSTLTGLAPATISYDTAEINSVTINTGPQGVQQLAVDFAAGNPIPTFVDGPGLSFNGGANENSAPLSHGMVLYGSNLANPFTDETNNASDPALLVQDYYDGLTPFDGDIQFADSHLSNYYLEYTGLQPIVDIVPVTNYIFNDFGYPDQSFSAVDAGPYTTPDSSQTVANTIAFTSTPAASTPPTFETSSFANKTNVTFNSPAQLPIIAGSGITGVVNIPTTADGLVSLTFNTGDGDDVIDVMATPPIVVVRVALGSGDNVVNIGNTNTLAQINGPVVVTDPTGTATLNILDSADTTSTFASLDNLSDHAGAPYEVTGLSGGPIAYGPGVTLLNIYGGSAGIDYTVAATQLGTSTNLYNNGNDIVDFTNNGSVTDISGPVYVENDGSGTHTALIVDASADTTDHTVTLTGGTAVRTLTGLAPVTISYVFASLSSLTIDTGPTGQQTLNVDFSAGNPIPGITTPGLIFNAGANATSAPLSHTMNLYGTLPSGPFTSETHTANDPAVSNHTANYGAIKFVDSTAATTSLNYSGLQPINDTVPVTNFTFNTGPGNQSVQIVDGPIVRSFVTTQISSTSTPAGFEHVNFANKVNVVVQSEAGNDTVVVNNPTAAADLVSLQINTGAGTDVVDVIATPPGVSFGIASGNGADVVNIGNGTLSGINTPVIVTNPTGTTTLNILDSADATSTSASLDNLSGYLNAPYELTGLSASPIAYGPGVTVLNVHGGTAGIHYAVSATQPGTATNLYNNGNDSVDITNDGSVTDILGPVYVENDGSGTHTAVVVDASADTTDHSATLTGGNTVSTLTGLAPITISYRTADLNSLTIDTGPTGQQTLNVDFGAGNPIPGNTTPGLIFNAGASASSAPLSHTLNLFGTLPSGAFTSETHTANDPTVSPKTANYGAIKFVDSTATTTSLTYSGLQPINDTVPVINFTFNTGAGNQSVQVIDGPSVRTFVTTQVSSTTTPAGFERVNFANKGHVVVQSQAGNDSVVVNNPTAATGLSTLQIDTGDGNDVVDVTATPSITSVGIALGNGNNVVNVGANNTLSLINSPVVVTDPTGTATLDILDSADATNTSASLDNQSGYLNAPYEVAGLSNGPVVYGPGVTVLNIYGGIAGIDYAVSATQLGTLTNLYNNGHDTVDVTNDGSVTDILGPVYVENDRSGTHTALIVDASADTSGHSATLAGNNTISTLTGLASATISYRTPDLNSLTVDTGPAGQQTLNVDFGAGNPIPSNTTPGLIFNAGANANSALLSHTLNLFGTLASGAFTSETHTANDPSVSNHTVNFGAIKFVDSTATTTSLTYSGLQPINDTVPVTNFTFNTGPGNQSVQIVDGPIVRSFVTTQISSTSTPAGFERVNFANKGHVVVQSQAGNDSVVVNNPTAATGLFSLQINTGDGNDVVDVTATPPITSFGVALGNGDDIVNITGSGLANGPNYQFDGGLGSDTLNYDSGTQLVDITPSTITFNGVVVNFVNFETVNVLSIDVLNTNNAGYGSLRQAIVSGNTHLGPDTLRFLIPGTGPFVIAPTTEFPAITDSLVIDGYNQAGASPNNLLIVLDGSHLGADTNDGLDVETSNCLIRGLVIGHFGGAGIQVEGNGNTIEGNYIGIDVNGTTAIGNGLDGVLLTGAANNLITGNVISGNGATGEQAAGVNLQGPGSSGNTVSSNRIGTDVSGTFAVGNSLHGVVLGDGASRNVVGPGNVISGNGGPLVQGAGVYLYGTTTQNNSVIGNVIGTNAAGTAAIGGASAGVVINDAPDNVVGGPTVGDRNIISGNAAVGIYIALAGATGNVVENNYIGTDISGLVGIPNGIDGIYINAAPGNRIGGTAPGTGNLISANLSTGIHLFGAGATGNRIYRNRIGLDANGRLVLPNRVTGIFTQVPLQANDFGASTGNPNQGQAVPWQSPSSTASTSSTPVAANTGAATAHQTLATKRHVSRTKVHHPAKKTKVATPVRHVAKKMKIAKTGHAHPHAGLALGLSLRPSAGRASKSLARMTHAK